MKSPIIMVKPPSPDIEIDLPAGVGRLGADRLQQGVGHRAVIERADQPALAVHLEVARRPDRRRADVAGEDRVVGRELADQPRDILRMDDVAARPALGQLVEIGARLAVVGAAPRRGTSRSVFGFSLRQQGRDRGADVADHAQIERAAVAEALRPDVDLRDPAPLGIELPVGEVGAEQQQRVALLHRGVAGGEADQAGHADIEGIVVLDMLLAAQRMHDRRVERSAELDDLGMGAGAAGAAQHA